MVDKFRSELINAFKEDAYELLTELESLLLELEDDPDNAELISHIFRNMHTVKGSAEVSGFNDVYEFTHKVENLLALIRNGDLPVTKDLLKIVFSARDHILRMINTTKENNQKIVSETRRLARLLGTYNRNRVQEETRQNSALSPGALGVPGATERSGQDIFYKIEFKRPPEKIPPGLDLFRFLERLNELGACTVVLSQDSGEPDPSISIWEIVLKTSYGIDAVRDTFLFVDDQGSIKVEVMTGEEEEQIKTGSRKIGEIILKKTQEGGRLRAEMLEADELTREIPENLYVEDRNSTIVLGDRTLEAYGTTIRVRSDKLDNLVDQVGELLLLQARLKQTAMCKDDAEIQLISEQVEKLVDSLRENTTDMRMVPIKSLFVRFRRLIHDRSADLGKEVNLITSGNDIQLDKSIIEGLHEPLVHLIRNSIDHGIELPEVRLSKGKPRGGSVRLSALQTGSFVTITVKDDGRGLDLPGIRKKAIESHLVSEMYSLEDKDLINLIFHSGFSTNELATASSGRGVGMEAVKHAIDSLRGTIDIQSAKGEGTCIVLKLPLTLAIITGLLVKTGEAYFVIPQADIEECENLDATSFKSSRDEDICNFRGSVLPLVRLHSLFQLYGEGRTGQSLPAGSPIAGSPIGESTPGGPPTRELREMGQFVVVNVGDQRVGLVVDQIMGEHQGVMKTLSKVYRNVKGLSGATILGDGTIALILDMAKLFESTGVSL